MSSRLFRLRPRERKQILPGEGHNLPKAFFNYFQEKGGVEIFGYPITEELQEDGLLVQYFQRARLVLTGFSGKSSSGSRGG